MLPGGNALAKKRRSSVTHHYGEVLTDDGNARNRVGGDMPHSVGGDMLPDGNEITEKDTTLP